ncbi:MAG: JAB domain-containing protein [Lachnospiraceae bacterium]|nr:JAB domain-containing protein [Lachnospiraceae bacterium]
MSKGVSGLFKGTKGFRHVLREETFDRTMPDGTINVDFTNLPGGKGIQVKRRLTDAQMSFLTKEYGVEFAQVYERGQGKNGAGGKYMIYSGTVDHVHIPINKNTVLINHTHPGGTAHPSQEDMRVMDLVKQAGSPQITSSIIPIGKNTVKFTSKGLKR